MARPKKNVDTKNNERDIFEVLKEINERLDTMESQIKDINDDLDEMCNDIYCDCEEETVEEEVKEETVEEATKEVDDWEEFITLLKKKISNENKKSINVRIVTHSFSSFWNSIWY